MRIQVELLSFRVFGAPPRLRTVIVPDKQWDPKVLDTDARLGLVFEYGQNDIQERDARSVSVGDIIEYPEENGYYSYYRIDGAGFSRLGVAMYEPKCCFMD